MTTSLPPQPEPTVYQPTADQLARDAALRRFNRLYVAVPIGLGVLVALVIIGLFLFLILAPDSIAAAQYISNLADIVMILGTIPLLVLCAILPIAYLAYLANRRQRRAQQPVISGPMANRSRVQAALWRVESAMDTVKQKTDETAPKVAEPFIYANARFNEAESWLTSIRNAFRRSNQRNE